MVALGMTIHRRLKLIEQVGGWISSVRELERHSKLFFINKLGGPCNQFK